MSKKLFLLGAGGHASSLLDCVEMLGLKVDIIYDSNKNLRSIFSNYRIEENDKEIANFPKDQVELINGLGRMPYTHTRKELFNNYKSNGFSFKTIISPSAIISKHSTIGEGVQILKGATIQAGTKIGHNTIINTRSIVDHDCTIGDHCHIATGATLSGDITIKDNVFIGAGATIINGITIGENSIIAAGATIYKDIPANSKVMGSKVSLL